MAWDRVAEASGKKETSREAKQEGGRIDKNCYSTDWKTSNNNNNNRKD